MAEKTEVQELQSRNDRQKATIVEMTVELNKAGKKISELQIWERFMGYLIDNCEGQTVSEESLQGWLAQMLADEAEQLKGGKV